jgi:prepilin-type N-terminal cleavage/methylation domain-containing protein
MIQKRYQSTNNTSITRIFNSDRPIRIPRARAERGRLGYWQAGFSLSEMIIAVAIFVLIIVVVYSVYILGQRGYQRGEEAAEVIQNGRVVLERISREIRQARDIITELPAERTNPPAEIKIHDGHLSPIFEEGTARGGDSRTIDLKLSASGEDDYYKDMFIKVTGGAGAGQIRKISDYDGINKRAEVEDSWDTIPDATSTYKIDTYFYYIRYYRDENNNVWRGVSTYCFSADLLNCVQPGTYVSWNSVPPPGQTLLEVTLSSPRIIGEYVTNLEFWGSRVISIFLTLEKKNKTIDLETKVFGRNL